MMKQHSAHITFIPRHGERRQFMEAVKSPVSAIFTLCSITFEVFCFCFAYMIMLKPGVHPEFFLGVGLTLRLYII
jgi:hypothetical protein